MSPNDPEDARTAVTRSFLSLRARLRRFVGHFSVRPQDGEEIVQEIFLRAHESEQRRKIDAPHSFLFTVAKKVALPEIRRKATLLLAYISDFDDLQIPAEPCVESDADAQQKAAAVLRIVSALPAQCQQVVIMRKVLGLSHEEIGRQLDISVKTVEKHLSKALKHCQDALAHKAPAIGSQPPEPGHTERARAGLGLEETPAQAELLALRGRE